jgi:myo-inositol-1(or 4)-monophosphatase
MSDWSVYFEAAREAARRAGTMLHQNIDAPNPVHFKGEVNLVTDCDTEAQKIIFDYLYGLFPDHGFLAEEGLTRETGSDFLWIIDPLDGTTNFAHRFPVFSVSIALQEGDEVRVGVVYDPTREEMFGAVQGEGARLNGRKLAVSTTAELRRSLLATGFPYDIHRTRDNINHFLDFITRAQAVRRCGSAALDLCYVASGRFDGFWEKKLNPWDVAAGGLIVREAGGLTTDLEGTPMKAAVPDVLASNGLIHRQMLETLKLGFKGGQTDDRT